MCKVSDMAEVNPLYRAIERRMQKLGLNRYSLAERAGLGRTAIYDIESKPDRSPRTTTLKKIAKALGCTVSDLLREADISEEGPALVGRPREATRSDIVIREFDVRAGAGDFMVNGEDREAVIDEWAVPERIIRGHTTAPAKGLAIITVYGDSMSPDFLPGERVMVDTSDCTPSPPGVFVLWDGLGLVIKRVELVPYSDPPQLELISRNEQYRARELPASEVHIKGRVIGKWLWT